MAKKISLKAGKFKPKTAKKAIKPKFGERHTGGFLTNKIRRAVRENGKVDS